ncbi:MAG: amidohydrolase family protein [Planctomycetes bacterium]|nr:amidohydrolase family protein [Planctomycetota bacterium]
MHVNLFDVQAGFGGAKPGTQAVTVEALTGEMDRLDIARALVRTLPDDLDGDAVRSNATLFRAAAADNRLVPCPVVLPAALGDVPGEAEQASCAVAAGARAVCIRPDKDGWSLEPWCAAVLFEALAARRLPVLCDQKHVTTAQVAALAAAWGDLPLILAGAGYRQMRTLVPLMTAFANVYFSIGSNFTVHGGLESLAARIGADRLLFGTGFPDAEGMMAITQLMYADLADEQKRLIGAGNLERLIGEVRS